MSFPFDVSFTISNLFGGAQQHVTFTDGLMILVGPNGSGKTQVLTALRNQLQPYLSGKKIRYVSPGRLAAIEQYRSDVSGNQGGRIGAFDGVPFGQQHLMSSRHNSSGIVGDMLALHQRPDIRIKVEARLLALFNRRITLQWTQSGLQTDFIRADVGRLYAAGQEASGLLHLISILAATFDDEVGALLLDEPEVSLHSQLQAYILREIRNFAGDPSVAGKKLVVISTHSPTMLQVRHPKNLTNLIFFQDSTIAPKQIPSAAPELQAKALTGLLARMGESHRLAFFAQRLLLVEGPSDEIIANALALRLELPLEAAGTQIVPVIGKGEMSAVRKLFRLMGKDCTILTDLDGFVDDNSVINEFYDTPAINQSLSKLGHRDLRAFSNSVRDDLKKALTDHYNDLSSVAEQHPYWINRDQKKPMEGARARAGTAVLLSMDEGDLNSLPQARLWISLRARLLVLLDVLEQGGCFVLRRGALECYSLSGVVHQGLRAKPETAVAEADLIMSEEKERIRQIFDDIIRALIYSASRPYVDEAAQLRQLLLGVLAPCLDTCPSTVSKDILNQRAQGLLKETASLFTVETISIDAGMPRLRVKLNSKLFDDQGFPIEVTKETLYSVLNTALPSRL